MPEDTLPDEHYLKQELYALVQGNEIFDFLQQGALDGVWYWDLENPEHEWMSPELWTTFGYDPATKQHLAAEWQDMIHPDDLAVALANFAAHTADPTVPYDQNVRYTHADGSTVWVRCRGIAIRDDTGKPIRMLGVHQDITQLKLAEQAAAEVGELKSSNVHLARFAYVVSHDLKAPLRGIRTCVDWLAEDLGDDLTPDIQETLDLLANRASRLSSMIEGVLAYSRVDGMADPIEVDANVALQDAIDALQVPESLAIHLQPLPTVVYNPSALMRVFMNLLANAIDHLDGGTLRVSSRRDDGYDVFLVDDDGPGIPVAERTAVFGMFTTLRPRDDTDNTGMGLAITRAIVEHHGGTIVATDSPLGGCRMQFTVPLAR